MQRVSTPTGAAMLQDERVRQHVARRITELLPETELWPDGFGQFFVVDPGDSMASLEDAAAWPLFQRNYTDNSPIFEWVEQHDGLYEIAYVLADSGQFIVLIVPATPAIDKTLLTFCQQHATTPLL